MKKRGTVSSLPLTISQNYLTSTSTIRRLIRRTSLTKNDYVIEIGAGKGHITRELSKTCRLVEAYEIDGKLFGGLQKCFTQHSNVSLRHQDFLTASLPSGEPYKVFSNLPFSITSDIVRRLTSAKNPPRDAWLVMEKGAAKRFMGRPCDTPASLSIQPFFQTEIVYYFSREDFHPMPRADAVLLHLRRKAYPDIPLKQRTAFRQFIEKSLRHGLTRQLTKKQISTALRLAGLPALRDSQAITCEQWLCLFQCHCKFNATAQGKAPR